MVYPSFTTIISLKISFDKLTYYQRIFCHAPQHHFTWKSTPIAHPINLDNSLRAWDIDILLNELKMGANSGGPLWSIRPLQP